MGDAAAISKIILIEKRKILLFKDTLVLFEWDGIIVDIQIIRFIGASFRKSFFGLVFKYNKLKNLAIE